MMIQDIDIVYRDAEIVVINKPGGLLSVPGRGPDKQDCAAARLQEIIPSMIAQPAVHRLDMYTSGLMVMAVTKDAHRALNRQFELRQVAKEYQALLEGVVAGRSGEIILPFRLDPDNRPYQVYDPEKGKTGVTRWQLLGVDNGLSRVRFTPLTGRTHQLRLHAAHPLGLNCPIVGDSLYGRGSDGDPMMLHANFLHFQHPETGEALRFDSSPPF